MALNRQWHAVRWPAALVLLASALLWSSWARTDPFAQKVQEPSRGTSDPATGALLLDLRDDLSSSSRARIARLLAQAIEPVSWPQGPREGLGTPLSEAAQLYRVEAPASEHADVLALLRQEEAVEAIELERLWTLPEHDLESEGFATDRGAVSSRAAGEGMDGEDRTRRGPFVPNDPYYKHQWHLDQIQMPKAWLRARGKGAVVAIIDTGVAFESRQARRKRFTMAPDLTGVRFVPGYDFVDRDAHPTDEHGHGTHVAGTVAQATNNSLGVAGVAPAASIMPLRVLDARGRGSLGNVAAAIRWAADHGANVINMSLGGGLPSKVVRNAIDHAHAKGVVVVAAAGNAGRSRVEYPARHRHVIAVGAVRFDEQLTFYSCYGKGLDVVAPGGDTRVDQNGDGLADGVLQNTLVRGTTDRHDYVPYMGTSMAAPHVAGVAALLWSRGVRDPDAIERVLKGSAKTKSDTTRYGAGLVQADDALRQARTSIAGGRGLLALALSVLMMLALRFAGRLSPDVGVWQVGAWAFVLAGGLALLPLSELFLATPLASSLGAPLAASSYRMAAALTAGVPGLMEAASAAEAVLLAAALLPLTLTLLLLGVRRSNAALVGLSLAVAAWLGLEAMAPTIQLWVVPTWIAGPWLLLQATFVAALAMLTAHKRRSESLLP